MCEIYILKMQNAAERIKTTETESRSARSARERQHDWAFGFPQVDLQIQDAPR